MPPAPGFDPNGNPLYQDEDSLQDHFEEFYEDIFEELTNIGGELEQLRVCENLSDHLMGNVYAKFREEEDAEKALQKLMVCASPHRRPPARALTPEPEPRPARAAWPTHPHSDLPSSSPGRTRPICAGRRGSRRDSAGVVRVWSGCGQVVARARGHR